MMVTAADVTEAYCVAGPEPKAFYGPPHSFLTTALPGIDSVATSWMRKPEPWEGSDFPKVTCW